MNSHQIGITQSKCVAIAELYHAYFTGLVLYLVSRRSPAQAAELVFRVFRRQHKERFLPGLEKLGIAGDPPAVAAAKYHYLSNLIGGVRVEFMPESDRKAWIRYAPPRWLWEGTALCGVPSEVSLAMLRGWHAHNGVSLGLSNVGFVCTKQGVDGQNGLEGYYKQFNHDLEPEERLQFARHEEAPEFDPDLAPRLPSDTWPQDRLDKAHRNYAMEYTRTALLEAIHLFGPEEGGHILRMTGRLVGMQYHDRLSRALMAPDEPASSSFASFMRELLSAQGDRTSDTQDEGGAVVQETWNLMAGASDFHPACASGFQGLVEGMLASHDRWATLEPGFQSAEAPKFIWRIDTSRRRASPKSN